MRKILMKDLKQYFDKEITIDGFIDNIRDLQWVQFVILRDGTGKVQVTIEKSLKENKGMVDLITNATLESTAKITGILKENSKVKLNGMEFIPTKIEITSYSLSELPIDIKDKDKTLRETRLDNRFLDLRREDNNLLFKCQTLLLHSMREFWLKNDFMEISSPKISGAAAESGAELFKVDYFGTTAYLSQSPQFYKQMALAAGFDKVFEIGPAFRAENSHTSYHASEINMIDVEIAWIDSVEDVMDHEEVLLKYSFNKLKEIYGEKIKEIFGIEISNTDVSFPRIPLKEVKKIIKEEYNYVGVNEGDLERKEEEYIWKYVKEKYNSDFVFVTEYPFESRVFYHMVDDNNITKSFDLIYKGIEITTGAQREHRPDVLIKQIENKGIKKESLNFYIDFFRYGCPPHGGFAIGVARLMMQIFEIDNIREATFIYRGPTRLVP